MTMPTIQLSSDDHDLIIQLHAKFDSELSNIKSELSIIKDLEYRVRAGEDKDARHSEKIEAVKKEVADSVLEIKDDIKSLRSRDLWQSLALIAGTVVASVIAWFHR